jgi:hypothetical protein
MSDTNGKPVNETGLFDKLVGRFFELKAKRPRLLFFVIMGIETINFATDVAQLVTVVNNYGKYNAPPWYYDDYTKWGVEWDIVSPQSPGGPYLLAFPLDRRY